MRCVHMHIQVYISSYTELYTCLHACVYMYISMQHNCDMWTATTARGTKNRSCFIILLVIASEQM
jgi:hypothetical protein